MRMHATGAELHQMAVRFGCTQTDIVTKLAELLDRKPPEIKGAAAEIKQIDNLVLTGREGLDVILNHLLGKYAEMGEALNIFAEMMNTSVEISQVKALLDHTYTHRTIGDDLFSQFARSLCDKFILTPKPTVRITNPNEQAAKTADTARAGV